MNETYNEHRQRDDKTWAGILLAAWVFPSIRWLIPVLLIAVGGAWAINVLGESTVLNSPDIYYGNKNPVTGEVTVTKGCRAERMLPDGTCDKSITLDTVRKAFPFFGPAKTTTTK